MFHMGKRKILEQSVGKLLRPDKKLWKSQMEE